MNTNKKFPIIHTRRLNIFLPTPDRASEVALFFLKNKEFHKPWEPIRPTEYFSELFWRFQLKQSRKDFHTETAVRFFAETKQDHQIIASCSYYQIIRGVQESCTLGYSIDKDFEGQGYMRETLKATIYYIFHSYNLHRIEATHLPENIRSHKLLRSLNFQVEGYLQKYCKIQGEWRDHFLTALVKGV